MKFELGSTIRDRVSGYKGIAIGVVTYLTGCDQYLVQARMTENQISEGTKKDAQWFDVNRCEQCEGDVIKVCTDDDKGFCDMAPLK